MAATSFDEDQVTSAVTSLERPLFRCAVALNWSDAPGLRIAVGEGVTEIDATFTATTVKGTLTTTSLEGSATRMIARPASAPARTTPLSETVATLRFVVVYVTVSVTVANGPAGK